MPMKAAPVQWPRGRFCILPCAVHRPANTVRVPKTPLSQPSNCGCLKRNRCLCRSMEKKRIFLCGLDSNASNAPTSLYLICCCFKERRRPLYYKEGNRGHGSARLDSAPLLSSPLRAVCLVGHSQAGVPRSVGEQFSVANGLQFWQLAGCRDQVAFPHPGSRRSQIFPKPQQETKLPLGELPRTGPPTAASPRMLLGRR